MMTNSTKTSPPPRWRTFESDAGSHILFIEGSRVFDISEEMRHALLARDSEALASLEPMLELGPSTSLEPQTAPAPQSISLNISNSCNLGCSYCYASRGSFEGAQSQNMLWPEARAAIDRLLAGCDRSAPATIGFLGGEPLVRRALVHRATKYAATRGRALEQDVRFSITTNGTLINDEDHRLMRSYPFAVTISIDGGRKVQVRQRPGTDFDRLVRAVEPLLANPGHAKLSARATVTRSDFELTTRFDAIREIGFEDVGFSPVRVGGESQALSGEDWVACLSAYRELGVREMNRIRNGEASAFSNLMVALKQIHRGACSPYPCGAGGGYFSVSADGDWYACHRAIGQDEYALGDSNGLLESKRRSFLDSRHVHEQSACRSCWARYLCSGSCHQEAAARNESSCDFIRGWLEFCLSSYASLDDRQRRSLFSGAQDARQV